MLLANSRANSAVQQNFTYGIFSVNGKRYEIRPQFRIVRKFGFRRCRLRYVGYIPYVLREILLDKEVRSSIFEERATVTKLRCKCWGSGSEWIHIDLALLDPPLYWEG
jgi:hypothetical protein